MLRCSCSNATPLRSGSGYDALIAEERGLSQSRSGELASLAIIALAAREFGISSRAVRSLTCVNDRSSRPWIRLYALQ